MHRLDRFARRTCAVSTPLTLLQLASFVVAISDKRLFVSVSKPCRTSRCRSVDSSVTQAFPGCLVLFVFLLVDSPSAHHRPVCSNILCIPLLLFYSSTGKTRIQVAAFLSTSCLAEDPIVVCIDFRKVSLTPTLSNTLQHYCIPWIL